MRYFVNKMSEYEKWDAISMGRADDGNAPLLPANTISWIERQASVKPKPLIRIGYEMYYSKADAAQEYVSRNGCAKPKSYLSNMKADDYQVHVSPRRTWYDKWNQLDWVYYNVALHSGPKHRVEDQWVLSLITCEDVVQQSVEPRWIANGEVRQATSEPDHRVMGADYTRFGLPRFHFEPIIRALQAKWPDCITAKQSIVTSQGYYWVNAAWGGTGRPGKFVIRSSSNHDDKCEYTCLKNVMKSLGGNAAEGTMEISLAVRCLAGNEVSGPFELAVKCLSLVEIEDTEDVKDEVKQETKPVERVVEIKEQKPEQQDEGVSLSPMKQRVCEAIVVKYEDSEDEEDDEEEDEEDDEEKDCGKGKEAVKREASPVIKVKIEPAEQCNNRKRRRSSLPVYEEEGSPCPEGRADRGEDPKRVCLDAWQSEGSV